MSISADTMRLLMDGGKGIPEFILVAQASERGDDMRHILGLIDKLRDLGATPKVIAIAICGLAESILESHSRYVSRSFTDEHTCERDSNRSRRNMPTNEWRELREQIFERDGYACTYCGSCVDLTCDHVIPLVRGGTNGHDNLTTACRSCNSSKRDKLVAEWSGPIR